MAEQQTDPFKEKFRPDDSALDKEIEAALGGMSIEALYDYNKPDPAAAQRAATAIAGGTEGSTGGPTSAPSSRNYRRGRVMSVSKDDVFIDFGGKSQGIAPMQQFETEPKVGEEMDFVVDRYDEREGLLILHPKGAAAANVSWETLEVGQIVEGNVTGMNKGGLELEVKGMRAFMPAGQVDLGGADGLLHVSEMSWKRGQKPSDFVKVGDLVDVKIIKLDKETGKMSLSLKQAMADPWAGAETRYAVGTTLTGRVTKVEPFGAFVEAEEGLEGLLPVSEMSWQRIRHPSDVVKVGDTIKLVVISLDPAARRMSFSLKQAGPDPWSTVKERYAQDMVVGGKVTRVVDFGAFVELEPGLEGLIHISELANTRVRAAGDVVRPGQDVQVRVLEVDKDARRISLSLKRAAEPGAAAAGAGASATAAAPAAPVKKKKRPELKGGLEW